MSYTDRYTGPLFAASDAGPLDLRVEWEATPDDKDPHSVWVWVLRGTPTRGGVSERNRWLAEALPRALEAARRARCAGVLTRTAYCRIRSRLRAALRDAS